MANILKDLLENNSNWAHKMTLNDPLFFLRLSQQQAPKYLWIGCSDSRVPANQIVGLLPGEIFVHRNVANIVAHTDLNCLSALQFAVDVLKVEHIMVCGHYGCGGVHAAFHDQRLGLISNWLRCIQDVKVKYKNILATIENETQKVERLCELNVLEQVVNVCQTTILQTAWERNQNIHVHGWIYGIKDGIIKDLGINISGSDEIEDALESALAGA